MKKFLISFLWCTSALFMQAQRFETAVIHACAEGAENRTVRLYLEDAITKFQWKVDEQIIDNEGCFRLSVELPETQRAFIKIDFYQTYIYLESGREYHIIFDSFDFRIDEQINPFRLDRFLSYRFEEPDSNELNRLIWRFENLYDHFLVNNYAEGITREQFNIFRDEIQQTFAYSGHGYFNHYKRYALADMERIFRLTSSANLFLTQIQDRPILYNNTAFADFVIGFYSNYFPHQVRYNRNVFIGQINHANDLSGILDSLGRDTTLQNEKLREFVLLLGLRELYHHPDFQNLSILRLLLDIESTTKFHEHAVLANLIIQMLMRHESGVNRAEFKFSDPEKSMLYDFSESSKYKYILFVNSLCESCNTEVSLLQSIAKNFRNEVNFYVVNCDYEANRALRNKPRNLQNILYLHFNKDFETLENLGISDYPIAVWVDPENIIQSYYFPVPSRRAERTIRQLLSE
jgi:thiol-disulfide isomerase/thioredoxin